MARIRVQPEIGEYLGLLPNQTGRYEAPASERLKIIDVVDILARQEARLSQIILELQQKNNNLQLVLDQTLTVETYANIEGIKWFCLL